MNDKAPVRPDQPTGSPMGEDRSFPPNSEDPSRVNAGSKGPITSREIMERAGVDPDGPFEVGPFPAEMRERSPQPVVGFPSGAVETLKAFEWPDRKDFAGVLVDHAALTEVLAWIDRYVPRPLEAREVLSVATFTVEVDDPLAERVELIHFNGRTFVEETPTIASEGPFTAGLCSVHTDGELDGAAVFGGDGEPYCLISSDAVVGGDPMPRATLIANLLNEEAKGLDLGAACDEVVAFERRPPVEGLECVKTLGPAYARDVGGRPVHIGEAEPTDAEGRFPGDLGYVRPE